jgi:hypothetical protein
MATRGNELSVLRYCAKQSANLAVVVREQEDTGIVTEGAMDVYVCMYVCMYGGVGAVESLCHNPQHTQYYFSWSVRQHHLSSLYPSPIRRNQSKGVEVQKLPQCDCSFAVCFTLLVI